MPRRAKSPLPGPPTATLRWFPVGKAETHSTDAKMSDTLLHFLDPMLDIDESPDPQAIKNMLALGAMVWNLGTYEMPQWRKESPIRGSAIEELRTIAAHPGAPEGLFQIAEALLHRRRTLFGKDLRCIVDYEMLPDPDSPFRLRCNWMLPDR